MKVSRKYLSLFILVFWGGSASSFKKVGEPPTIKFKKHVLTNEFISEGVAASDVNKDGLIDIIAGSYWFEAPNWKPHEIVPPRVFDPMQEYSDSYLYYTLDVNNDGWEDLIWVDFPGKVAHWYENPKNEEGHWKKHVIGDHIGIANESPGFVDVDGDGRKDLLCGDLEARQMVWLQAPLEPGETEWKRHPISEPNAPGTEMFSHGLGFGDINGDGRKDVVVKQGWWEGPESPFEKEWKFHPAELGEDCSHMQVMDVNGDGRNDVVSASAHGLGIWWHEQLADGKWRTHLISEIASETHATILVDFNEDGNPDFVTGKRFLSHHQSIDENTFNPSYLLWFESTPNKAPYWKQHIIDEDSGAGLNIVAEDINKDGRMDLVVANKKGVFYFENTGH